MTDFDYLDELYARLDALSAERDLFVETARKLLDIIDNCTVVDDGFSDVREARERLAAYDAKPKTEK